MGVRLLLVDGVVVWSLVRPIEKTEIEMKI